MRLKNDAGAPRLITDGLTLGGITRLEASGHVTGQLLAQDAVLLSGTQTFGGTGTVQLGSETFNAVEAAHATSSSPASLTIASGINFAGDNGELNAVYTGDSIILDAPINATRAGQVIGLGGPGASGTLINDSTITVSGGASLVGGSIINNGTITASGSGTTVSIGTGSSPVVENSGTMSVSSGAAFEVSGLSGGAGNMTLTGTGSSPTLDGTNYSTSQGSQALPRRVQRSCSMERGPTPQASRLRRRMRP